MELCSKAISICRQDEETSANEDAGQEATPKGGRGKRKAGGDRCVVPYGTVEPTVLWSGVQCRVFPFPHGMVHFIHYMSYAMIQYTQCIITVILLYDVATRTVLCKVPRDSINVTSTLATVYRIYRKMLRERSGANGFLHRIFSETTMVVTLEVVSLAKYHRDVSNDVCLSNTQGFCY